MLGRLKRTTRLDVGLALSFAGIAYLVWALVAGVSRRLVQELFKIAAIEEGFSLPADARWVKLVFVNGGILIDLVGLAWLALSLFLVVRSSRQRARISWAWVSAVCQVIVAALGAVLVGWAAYQPHVVPPDVIDQAPTTWEQIRAISLPVVVAIAVLLWVTFLIWLLVERARLNRRGPTLTDGVRTSFYR
ncbi:MAG: hypothetical protein KGY99_04305 [Phycisphaerae bacterium]|nr:hypothetical protein [Phycisphaerae bacterium]